MSSTQVGGRGEGRWEFITHLFPRDPALAPLVALFYCIASVLSVSSALVFLGLPRAWALVGVVLVTVVISRAVYPRLRAIMKAREDPPKGTSFQPIGALTVPWPRDAVNRELAQAIRSISVPAAPVIVVSGHSGSGKSTVVSHLLSRELTDWNIATLPGLLQQKDAFPQIVEEILGKALEDGTRWAIDGTFKTQPSILKKATSRKGGHRQLVVAFDQFEQILIAHDQDTRWVSALFRQLQELRIPCILVVRREYFYDLLSWSPLASSDPPKRVHVPGFRVERAGQTRDADVPLTALRNVIDDVELWSKIEGALAARSQSEEILPLELQMIGLMFEDIPRESWGRIRRFVRDDPSAAMRALVHRYFLRYISTTTDTDTTKAVLYALSTGRSVRRAGFPIEDLAGICQRSPATIRRSLDELGSSGLVVQSRRNYSWSHDHLAELYHELSGALLDPIERDNITYFSDRWLRGQVLEPDVPTEAPGVFAAVNVFFCSVFVVLVVRLMYPCLGLQPAWAALCARLGVLGRPLVETTSLPFDVDYIPSFMASTISGWYIWQIHRNFFLSIPSHRSFSWFSIIFAGVMMLTGVVVPHAWAVFASLAGLLIAVHFWRCSRERTRSRINAEVAKLGNENVLRKAMRDTFLAMTVSLLLASLVAFASYFWPEGRAHAKLLLVGEMMVAGLYVLFIVECYRTHATKSKGALFLSALNRLRVA